MWGKDVLGKGRAGAKVLGWQQARCQEGLGSWAKKHKNIGAEVREVGRQ